MGKVKTIETIEDGPDGKPVTMIEIVDLPAFQVSRKEMDACIRRHEAVLTTLIRSQGGSPADGGILTLINTIDALRRLPTTD